MADPASNIDNAHKFAEGFAMSQVDIVKLRTENHDLKQNVESLKEDVERLEARIRGYPEQIQKLEQELKDTLREHKEETKAHLLKQQQLELELQPGRTNNKKERDAGYAMGYATGIADTKSQYERETIPALKARHVEELNREVDFVEQVRKQIPELKASFEQEKKKHIESIQELRTTVKTAERNAERQSTVNKTLASHLEGRQKRGITNRDGYPAYRRIFGDVSTSTYRLAQLMSQQEKFVQQEAELWRKSAQEFTTAKQLFAFRQQSKYNVIKKSINDFLEERAAHSELGAQDLELLQNKLRDDLQALSSPSHHSRTLTRLFHFKDEPTARHVTDVAYEIIKEPFVVQLTLCESRIEELKGEVERLKSQGLDKVSALGSAARDLKIADEARLVWLRLLNIVEAMRRLKGYQAVQDDSPVEKAVFLRAMPFEKEISDARKKYRALSDHISSDYTYPTDEQEARRALDEFEALTRDRCALQQEMGQLSQDEQREADMEIVRLIQREASNIEYFVSRVGPSIRALGRQRRSVSSPASSSVRPTSIADMRSNLTNTLASNKSGTFVKPTSGNELRAAFKTPQASRTPEQALLVLECQFKKAQHATKRQTADSALSQWKSLVENHKGTGQRIRAQPDTPASVMETWDTIISTASSNIARLTIEMRAQATSIGLPQVDIEAFSRLQSPDRSSVPLSGEQATNGDDTSHQSSGHHRMSSTHDIGSEQGANDEEPSKNDSGHDSTASTHDIGSDAKEQANVDAKTRTGLNVANATSRKSRRRSVTRRSLAPLVRKQSSYASLSPVYDAKYLSEGSASGGLKFTPTASRQAAHPTAMLDKRHFHGSTRSMVDNFSGLKDADMQALDEAFATMQLPSVENDIGRAQDIQVTKDASSCAPSEDVDDASPTRGTGSDRAVELSFEISPKEYRAAVMASPNSNAAFWSHRLYKGADGKSPAVFYCKTFEAAERQAKLFLEEQVLGFDLEWEPNSQIKSGNIKRNVSLIQIAAEDKIGLFQVALFKGEKAEELVPPSLKIILESPNVIKAGVNVIGDSRRMRELLNVDMKGVFELSHMYRLVKYSETEPKNVSFRLVSLADQVHNVLMLPLKKDDNRISAWSRELNTQQTDYAASDAYAGFRLFHKLDSMRRSMSPMPPRPSFLEDEQPLILGDGTKIFKSSKKPAGARNAAAKKDADPEEDEFFDAVEEQDPWDLNSKEEPLGTGEPAIGEQADSIAYPVLPPVSVVHEFTTEASTNARTHAPGGKPAINSTSTNTLNDRSAQKFGSWEVKQADAWVAEWRFSLPPDWTVSARDFELRAYHLWHHQGLELKQVAALCREPPLALTTVASYVMQALKEENLPYEVERIREPRDILPTSVHRRYQKLFERVPT